MSHDTVLDLSSYNIAAGAFLVTQPAEKPEGQVPAAQTDGETARRDGSVAHVRPAA